MSIKVSMQNHTLLIHNTVLLALSWLGYIKSSLELLLLILTIAYTAYKFYSTWHDRQIAKTETKSPTD